jgi:O-antigen/teichoic acid export membrane protein
MSTLPLNLLANLFGQGIGALLALIFIPVYLRYLGSEGYGLVGLYTALYAVLSIIDSSFQALLARVAARAVALKEHEILPRAVRTVEWVFVCAAGALILIFLASSDALSRYTLTAYSLSSHTIASALQMMAIALGLRFFEGLYRAVLMGLERQVLSNAIQTTNQFVRWAGAAAILAWVDRSVEAFFLWQVLASLIGALLFRLSAAHVMQVKGAVKADWRSLWGERRFLSGMFIISGGAVLLTQTDKLLLANLLPLAEFGQYALAATAAGALMLLVAPIADAFYPRLVRSWTMQDEAEFAETFHLAAQLVSVFAGTAAIAGIVYAPWMLQAWTGNQKLAEAVTPMFQILLAGNLLNAFMWIPYRAQLAAGWSGLAAQVNIVSVIVLIPMLILATTRHGALAAAWVWVALNLGYLTIGTHFMYKRLLTNHRLQWYLRDLFFPMLASMALALACYQGHDGGCASHSFVLGFLCTAISLLAAVVCADRVRHEIIKRD